MTPVSAKERAAVASVLIVLMTAVFLRSWLLFVQGWREEDNEQGWVVLPIVALLVWYKRPWLRQAPVVPAPAYAIVAFGVALFLQCASVWLGLEKSSGYFFVLATAALCALLFGSVVTRLLAFPLAFLAFMVPVPGNLLDVLSAPLQVLCARFAVLLAGLSGVSVQNEGVNLFIPAKHISFIVAIACSGIRSLAAMAMVAALAAYFMRVPLAAKWTIFALGLPLAVAGNVLRLYLVLIVANSYGESAGMAFHSGAVGQFVPFLVVLAGLITVGLLWERGLSMRRRSEIT